MSQSNRTLLILATVLALLNAWLFFFDQWSPSSSTNRSIFALSDTSAVDEILILNADSEIQIIRSGGSWQLNNQYAVDEGLRRLFFSILQRVRVRKPIDELPTDSIRVTLSGKDKKEFLVFSNPTKTRTYFFDPVSNESYEMEIPGYNEYLGSIFELSPNQWRDRLIMDENFRTIKSLSLEYTAADRDDLSVAFNDEFFTVLGLSKIDSSFVVDYLNQFQVFEVNEIISESQFPQYDSLSKTTPIATLAISSIKSTNPIEINLFPSIENNSFQLITNKDGELMVLDSRRAEQILAQPADFLPEQ